MAPDIQHHFGLIEDIPPSLDLHLATTPFLSTTRPQSPIRRHRSPQHELDSFLADLEPSLILEALIVKNDASLSYNRSAGDGKQSQQAFIRNAVATASPNERTWGIKAAKASKSIREWYDELASWPWSKTGQSNGFAAQYTEDQLAKTIPPHGRERHRSTIPSSEIKVYEMRVEDIKTDLGMLELEDLKGHVRDVHVTPNSKRTTQQLSTEAASYEHMDDFQAIITAAIVQSLPTLAKLKGLMNVWSLRLVVLRLIPDFMRAMASCKDSIISAQLAIGNLGLPSQSPISSPHSSTISSQRRSFSRSVFEDMQAVLEDQISETGRKLDTMLDLLEDSNDVLPEEWIDMVEELEEQQKTWAKKAEEVVQDYESRDFSTHDAVTILELDHHGPQSPEPPSHESIVFSNPSSESESAAIGDKALGAAFFASDESDLSNPQVMTAPLVRNVSVGVRKPTGLPKAGKSESTEATSAPNRSTSSIERKISNVESNPVSDLVSSMSRSGSIDSDSFSIGSSPEIQSATLAAYPGSPIQVTTPASSRPSIDYLNIAQQPDLHNPRSRKSWSGVTLDTRIVRHQRKRSSTFTASTSPSPGQDSYQSGLAVQGSTPDLAKPRSASIKSFEIVPRSVVRTIEVRRSRDSSFSLQNLSRDGRSPSRASKPEVLDRQEPDAPGSSSEASVLNLTMAQDRFMSDELPLDSHFDARPETPKAEPLPMSIAKTRSPFEKASSMSSRIPKASPQQRAATTSDLFTAKQPKPPLNNGDRLDARISTILTNIPANIRLTSSAETTTPTNNLDDSVSTKNRTSHLSRLSVSRLLRSKNSTTTTPPSALIRAATSTSSEPRTNGTSDIKLYHLHQPGSASPIKLYIRLVGDTGERVMVRVGGGWADLAEYLKEYASHHGKRAVSDNHFTIQTLTHPSSTSSSPTNSRPSSSSSAALRRQLTTPTPATAATAGTATGAANGITPLPSQSPFPPSTPPSFGSQPPFNSASSRNRTWSATSAGASASDTDGSPTPGLGLAGPKAKHVNISPRKQAWVDGMMRQARRTSVGGLDGPDGRNGVKGGVRRVFLGMSGGRRE